MITHYCPTLTLALSSDEADEAHQLLARMHDLGAEACGSPAHRAAVDEWGEFCRRVAEGNAARGDTEAWEWAPTWRLRPPAPSGGILPDLVRMVWQAARRRRQAPPARADVIPIRREGGR